jgi:type I restriction enzyme R subunit
MTYTEDALVEQPAISLFGEMQWSTANCYQETYGDSSTLGREHRGEVILKSKLFLALQSLNPDAPNEALNLAFEELTRDRSAMSMVAANQDVYHIARRFYRAGANWRRWGSGRL